MWQDLSKLGWSTDQGSTPCHYQICTMFPSSNSCHRKIGGALSGCKWGLGDPSLLPKNSQNFCESFSQSFMQEKMLGSWRFKHEDPRIKSKGKGQWRIQIWTRTKLPIIEGSWFQVPCAWLSPFNPILEMRIWKTCFRHPFLIFLLIYSNLALYPRMISWFTHQYLEVFL